MRIGEWQEEKPTEPGMYFIMYGDVEVAANVFFIELRACPDEEEGLYCGNGNSSSTFSGVHFDSIGSSYQWAKVLIGKESKSED